MEHRLRVVIFVREAIRLDLAQERGLQSGKAEIMRLPQPGPRQRECRGVAVCSDFLDRGPAGVAEAEQPRSLVERLAGGIVERSPKLLIAAVRCHQEQLRVATRDQQRQDREVRLLAGFCISRCQPIGIEMRFEMVDTNQRDRTRVRDRFGEIRADQQRTGQARSARHRYGVDLVESDPGLFEGFLDHRDDGRELRAGCQLGHDAAMGPMQLDLRRHDIGPDVAPIAHDRGGGFVAGRFDTEDVHETCRSSMRREAQIGGSRAMSSTPCNRSTSTCRCSSIVER